MLSSKIKIFGCCCLILCQAAAALSTQASLSQPEEAECIHPPYTIHFLSHNPVVVYIANFLTASEREHLLQTSASAFINSQTSDEHGSESLRRTRRSKSATVTRDAVTRCIDERALRFQGFDTPPSHLEPLQLVRYHANETYDLHTDWFTSPTQTTRSHGGNRLTSFFAYVLASEITGGGTTFPLVDAPKDERWCEYIDCDVPFDEGVTFRPIPGNAVFWVNLVDGRGDQRVIHSGSVVTSGEKVGLNIWTREGRLSPRLRGEVGDDQDEDEEEE